MTTDTAPVTLPADAKAWHAPGCAGTVGYTAPVLDRWGSPYALCVRCGGIKA